MNTVENILSLPDNADVIGTFAMSEINLRAYKDKEGFFLTFILQDKTGKIYGKIWDNAEKNKEKFGEDCIISVQGRTNLFSGKNQIIVNQFRFPNEDEYSIKDFLICSKKDPDLMLKELEEIMKENIKDKDVYKIWESFYTDKIFMDKFKMCPGGKGDSHHAFLHGLLEHTLSIVKVCLFYSNQFELKLNKNILLIGAFLHDIGKIVAYEYKIGIKMTDYGRLHGHIAPAYHLFLDNMYNIEIEDEKKKELIKVIGHLILSHHGDHDTILPMTQEALLLSSADKIDADAYHIEQVFAQTYESWSAFDSIKNRMFYKQKTFEESPKIIRRKLK